MSFNSIKKFIQKLGLPILAYWLSIAITYILIPTYPLNLTSSFNQVHVFMGLNLSTMIWICFTVTHNYELIVDEFELAFYILAVLMGCLVLLPIHDAISSWPDRTKIFITIEQIIYSKVQKSIKHIRY